MRENPARLFRCLPNTDPNAYLHDGGACRYKVKYMIRMMGLQPWYLKPGALAVAGGGFSAAGAAG